MVNSLTSPFIFLLPPKSTQDISARLKLALHIHVAKDIQASTYMKFSNLSREKLMMLLSHQLSTLSESYPLHVVFID